MSAVLSNLTMSGSYSYVKAYERTESLSMGYGGNGTQSANGSGGSGQGIPARSTNQSGLTAGIPASPQWPGLRGSGAQGLGNQDRVSLSDAARQLMGSQNVQGNVADPQKILHSNIKLLQDIIGKMTGTQVDLSGIDGMFGANIPGTGTGSGVPGTDALEALQPPQATSGQSPSLSQPSQLTPDGSPSTVSYQSQESYYERSDLNLKASGVIKTSDGQQIQFSIDLSVSSEFMAQRNINMAAGSGANLVANPGGSSGGNPGGGNEPINVNYDGNASDLKNMGFGFGLNPGGTVGSSPVAAPGRGFLSLNGAGGGNANKVGSLFSPSVGSGFAQMAKLLNDTKAFMDENDLLSKTLSQFYPKSAIQGAKDSSG